MALHFGNAASQDDALLELHIFGHLILKLYAIFLSTRVPTSGVGHPNKLCLCERGSQPRRNDLKADNALTS